MRFLAGVLILSALLLGGCVYHQPIYQGNIVNPTKAKQVRHGMTPRQVIALLGTPVLKNVYDDQRLIYVYTFQPSRSKMIKKRLIIQFFRNAVVHVSIGMPTVHNV